MIEPYRERIVAGVIAVGALVSLTPIAWAGYGVDLFMALLLLWQAVPMAVVAFVYRARKISFFGFAIAVAIALAGEVGTMLAVENDSSSTAVLLYLWAPVWLSMLLGIVIGLDALVRRRFGKTRPSSSVKE